MSQARRQKDLFMQALEITTPEERADFLARECGGDDDLRRQIEALLTAHGVTDSFLEKPAAALDATTAGSTAPPPTAPGQAIAPGAQVGPYHLLGPLGEGGMGVVYLAEQHEPVRRRVALKVIRPGMGDDHALARFEQERQALALMDHPNIARVLDAGATADGRPYFVMELVQGAPITDFCDEHRLAPRQRLELFAQVCAAVQHAHQKGIIHRDLKPNNILVALYDGKPVPKVIDFGLAKALEGRLTEHTLNTGYGAVVGTLPYMSPEQAGPGGQDVDTRTDVYSLGVVLYELLTGATPVDRQQLRGDLLEVLRLIREEDPARPSSRVGAAAERAEVAQRRGTEPAKLARLVRGDLDWVVMRALEKDRRRRYQSAAELGRDVEHYLKDEPVEAGPPGAAYRLRKFVRRNRGAVLAAVGVLLALLVGLGGTAWGLVDARAQRDEALAARDAEAQQTRRALAAEKKTQDSLARVSASELLLTKAVEREKEIAREAKKQALRAGTALYAIQMDQLLRARERNDPMGMAHALDAVSSDFRDTWEHRFLRDYCHRLAVPVGYRENGHCWAYAPDGATVASGHPRALRLWDPATGAELRALKHPGPVWAVAYSHDSRRVVTLVYGPNVEDPKCLKTWEVATGKQLWHADLPINEQSRQEFSPDDKVVLTTSVEGLLLLDAATGKVRLRVPNSRDVQRAAFSPDGQRLVVAGTGAGAKILDARTGKPQRVLAEKLDGEPVTYVAFGAGGDRALVSVGSKVRVWDARTGKESAGFFHTGGEVGLTADGRAFVYADWFDIQAVDLATGKALKLPWPPGKTTCPRLSLDGTRLVASGFVVGLGKAPPEQCVLAGLEKVDSDTIVGGFTPDGKQVYAAYGFVRDWTVRFWDAATGRELRSLKPRPERDRPLQLTADGRSVVYNDTLEGDFRIEDLDTGKEWFRLKTQSIWLSTSAVSADNRWVAIGGGFSNREGFSNRDGSVQVWDAATRKEYHRFAFSEKGDVPGLAFSRDSRLVAAGNAAGAVQIWDLTRTPPALLVKLQCSGTFRQVVFFPDGKRLLTLAGDTITVWELATGKAAISFPAPYALPPVLISPDEARVFCGSKVWDTATGQDVFTLPKQLRAWAISPDGRRLVVSGGKMFVAP
jgi:serine/threonine protein kinase/WD40 repeat protein